MSADAAEDVKAWLDETRVLLRAAELLVEWFTEESTEPDEYLAFKASLEDLPYRNLELLGEWLRVGDSATTLVSQWTATPFAASQELVRTALLQKLVETAAT